MKSKKNTLVPACCLPTAFAVTGAFLNIVFGLLHTLFCGADQSVVVLVVVIVFLQQLSYKI